jgi:hypothetical protein
MQRAAERKTKKFKWTVEFEVAECWVADGFDLTDERAHDMLSRDLGWASGHELKARVVKYAPGADVAKAQGYQTTSEVERVRKAGRMES